MGSAIPPTVNAQGSTMSSDDSQRLASIAGYVPGPDGKPMKLAAGGNPAKAAEMFMNWLTAGGKPKPVDPSEIFARDAALSGVRAKAAAGSGINGLFGVGSLIGDLMPKPVEPLKPLNQSPMQSGVPYSVPPLPKPGGG